MDLVPSPPQCPLLSETGMRDIGTLSVDEYHALERRWERFLRHQVRDVVLCKYHHQWLWTAMPCGMSRYTSDFHEVADTFRNSSRLEDCRLCDLFNKGPTPHRLSKMIFRLHQCRFTMGTTGWQPLAEIVTDSNAIDHVLRMKFPGIEQIRGQKPRKINPAQVDYGLLSTWIKKCTQQHKTFRCQPQSELIPGFKLIDCRTRTVTKICEQGCQYIALSYVWGDTVRDDKDHPSYPRTIEDAITVTVALGFHYLWVDRYCIDQSNKAEKVLQILLMGQIYSQSQLCIIAATGIDPNYGLPGVSKRNRKVQVQISLGQLDLVEQFLPPKSVRQSLWSTRGWTLQEGCLSRRKLIFTDEQAIFSCHEMCCQESLYSNDWENSNETYDGYSLTTLAKIIPSIWERKPENMWSTSDEIVKSLLDSYSKRVLRYDADIINAIRGVFKVLNVQHCWGIPFEQLPDGKAWTMSLAWIRKDGEGRKTGFPSWSWASTEAEKGFNKANTYPSVLQIKVLPPNSTWLDIDNYIQSYRLSSGIDLGRLLRVTGYVSRPLFVESPWKMHSSGGLYPYSGFFGILKTSISTYHVWNVTQDVESPRRSMAALNTLKSVALLVDEGDAKLKIRAKYLILVPHGSHYQRIGITDGPGDECSFEDPRPETEWSSIRFEYLQRTDDDFFAKKVRRTLILE